MSVSTSAFSHNLHNASPLPYLQATGFEVYWTCNGTTYANGNGTRAGYKQMRDAMRAIDPTILVYRSTTRRYVLVNLNTFILLILEAARLHILVGIFMSDAHMYEKHFPGGCRGRRSAHRLQRMGQQSDQCSGVIHGFLYRASIRLSGPPAQHTARVGTGA